MDAVAESGVSASVRVEQLRVAADARGWVAEPLAPADLPLQRNVHVVVSQPGAVRGNHRHVRGTETLMIAGPALFRSRAGDAVEDVEVPEGAVFRFTIPPGVAHAIQNTGTGPLVLVAFNSCPHDPAEPDVVFDPLIG